MTRFPEELLTLACGQSGVVSRRQVLDAGLTDKWVRCQLAARRWQRIHRGVYATSTGLLAWDARCWAAILYCGDGAVLGGRSALRSWTRTPEAVGDEAIEVVVDHSRRVRPTDGVQVSRIQDVARLVHPVRRPPILRLEAAVLLTASQARSPDGAIGVVADACQQRRTTPDRLFQALSTLPTNLRHHPMLTEILEDVATGAYSYLEVQYLRRVERPHGLPTGSRQRKLRSGRRVWFRDVEYVGLAVIVELDGRLGHETYDDRARDIDRDNSALALCRAGTTRLGYRQVISTPCETAQLVVDGLRHNGWSGTPRRCSARCPVRWSGS